MTIKYVKKGLPPFGVVAQRRPVSNTTTSQEKRQFIKRQDSLLTLMKRGVVNRKEGKLALQLKGIYLQLNGSEGQTSKLLKGNNDTFRRQKRRGIRNTIKQDAILSHSLWQKRMADLGVNSEICHMVLWENKSLREIDKENHKRSGWAKQKFKQGIFCFGSVMGTSPPTS